MQTKLFEKTLTRKEPKMDDALKNIAEKIDSSPGQGNFLDQTDKIFRRRQRKALFKMLEELDANKVEYPDVNIYKSIPQVRKEHPALLRFELPAWKNRHRIFWESLISYVTLAVHRVTDIDFNGSRGTIVVNYFTDPTGHFKGPETVLKIVRQIAYLVDNESLPTDYTRFRLMTEESDAVTIMGAKQATIMAAILKLI